MRILCVDDEQLMLKMLEMAVKEARPDAEVTAYRKQADLLEDARKNGCDIAFLDIHMRGMNGVELAKELKMVNPRMNIIFVTGFSEYTGDAMRLHASGKGGTGAFGSAFPDRCEERREATRTVLRQFRCFYAGGGACPV